MPNRPFLAATRQNEWLRLARFVEPMPVSTRGGLPISLLGLHLGGYLHPLPLGVIQPAIEIAVETAQQAAESFFATTRAIATVRLEFIQPLEPLREKKRILCRTPKRGVDHSREFFIAAPLSLNANLSHYVVGLPVPLLASSLERKGFRPCSVLPWPPPACSPLPSPWQAAATITTRRPLPARRQPVLNNPPPRKRANWTRPPPRPWSAITRIWPTRSSATPP